LPDEIALDLEHPGQGSVRHSFAIVTGTRYGFSFDGFDVVELTA